MSKPPIVFAPGMMCDARLFEKQSAVLRDDRDVSFADFSKDDAIGAMARRLLDDAPIRFYLAGLSMGGIVAFEAWRQAPERIAGLALLNTTPFADSPARRETRLSQIDRVSKGELKTVVMEELKPNYLSEAHKKDQSLFDDIYAMADALGPEVFVNQTKAVMARGDSTSTLSSITCPTLVIAGEEDEVCPPELHEIMHEGIQGSTYRVLKSCGHLSTMESPEQVTELIQKHIEQIER
ncbi:MAG: alpha/beta fold hydrolase [Pseudomonadota bacterium]